MSDTAYMDIAITSSGYWRSSRRGAFVMHSRGPIVRLLQGSGWVFRFAGLGALPTAGGLFAYLYARHQAPYNMRSDEAFVRDPLLLSVLAALFSLIAATGFVGLVETSSDCLLFCATVETSREQTLARGSSEAHMAGIDLPDPSPGAWRNGDYLSILFGDNKHGTIKYMPPRLEELITECKDETTQRTKSERVKLREREAAYHADEAVRMRTLRVT